MGARFASAFVVTLTSMTGRSHVRSAATVAATLALLAAGTHAAFAAPATDDQGFVDSWARCASPSTAVAFGSTATSRVAVCSSTDGQYQYRGVRVRDGAKLAVDAEPSGDNAFVAKSDGVTYTISPTALRVSAGDEVIRDEPWVTYSGPEAPASAPASPTSTTAPTSTTPSAPSTSTTPLPPPLPAEQGHG